MAYGIFFSLQWIGCHLLDLNTYFATMFVGFFCLLSLSSLDKYFFRHTTYVSLLTIWIPQFCILNLSLDSSCSWLPEALKSVNLTKSLLLWSRIFTYLRPYRPNHSHIGILVLSCSGIDVLFREKELARIIKRFQSAFCRNDSNLPFIGAISI